MVFGGRTNPADKFIEVTIVRDVAKDDVLLEDEVRLTKSNHIYSSKLKKLL